LIFDGNSKRACSPPSPISDIAFSRRTPRTTRVRTEDARSPERAGTLCAAAKILKANGATRIYAAVSHCLLNDVGKAKLLATPEIEQLVTTDAVPVPDTLDGKIKVIGIAPLLGEAIRRIHDGKSISSLFYIDKH